MKIRYNIAREGAIMFFDMLAIPADAPHPRNAHLFINYLLRPDVAAKNSALMHYATGNAAAYPLVDPAVYNDPGIYPTGAQTRASVPERGPQPGLHARAQSRVDALQDRDVTASAATCELDEVSKRFGDFVAVDNVSLEVARGEIFCLLGRLGLRQDHAAAHAGGLRDARAPGGCCSTARIWRPCRRTGGRST